MTLETRREKSEKVGNCERENFSIMKTRSCEIKFISVETLTFDVLHLTYSGQYRPLNYVPDGTFMESHLIWAMIIQGFYIIEQGSAYLRHAKRLTVARLL